MATNINYIIILSLLTYASGLTIDGVPQNVTTVGPWSPVLVDLPLAAGDSHRLAIAAIPAAAQLVLVQAHVQHDAVTLEQAAADGSGPERVTAPHVGLVVRLTDGQTDAAVTVTRAGDQAGLVLVAVTLLPYHAPVPGGCSQLEQVPDAPFFRVETVQEAFSHFTVPRAQLGDDRSMGFTCNSARGAMDYSVYVMYPGCELRSDYDTFKDAISKMLQPETMDENAYMVSGRDLMLPLRYTFALYTGYTVVYGAVVTGVVPGGSPASAAYVPAVVHGCPVLGGDDAECLSEAVSLHFYLTAALMFVSGAILLTVAATEFTLYVVLTTAVLVAALTVLTFRLLTWDDANAGLAIGSIVGLLAGLVYARQYTVAGWSRSVMTVGTTLLFGCTVGAMFLFIPDLQLIDLTSDTVFWLAFVLLALALSFFVMLPGLEMCIVVTRCVLGATWMTVSLAMLTGSLTVYVFGNLFRRAIYPEFRFAILQMRFLTRDYVCVAVFCLLLVVSLICSCVVLLRHPPTAADPRRRLGPRARHWAEGHRLLPDDRQRLLHSGYGATAPQMPASA